MTSPIVYFDDNVKTRKYTFSVYYVFIYVITFNLVIPSLLTLWT